MLFKNKHSHLKTQQNLAKTCNVIQYYKFLSCSTAQGSKIFGVSFLLNGKSDGYYHFVGMLSPYNRLRSTSDFLTLHLCSSSSLGSLEKPCLSHESSDLELERCVTKNSTSHANLKICNSNYILGEGESNQQTCEEVTDRITGQRAWTDHKSKRSQKATKRGLSRVTSRACMSGRKCLQGTSTEKSPKPSPESQEATGPL